MPATTSIRAEIKHNNPLNTDVHVSLSFNAGRSALVRSNMIRHIDKGEYAKAAESIKVFRAGGGNGPRRRRESSNFINGDYK